MKKWSLSGYDGLSQGICGNAGQNLYVSAKGVLQRIWQFDVNKDGYVDLLIANSHDYNEHPDLYIISDPCGVANCWNVLTRGCQAGHVCDLNGDGYADVILAANNDGHHSDLPSYVYLGGKGGVTENRKLELAAPGCSCCVSGDFNGDGKQELCYLVSTGPEDSSSPNLLHDFRLRVYHTTDIGIEMGSYREYPADDIRWFVAGDIDGDGCDDLYCRTKAGGWVILWGSPQGFSRENSLELAPPTDDDTRFNLIPYGGGNVQYREFTHPKLVTFRGEQYLFYANAESVRLIHFTGQNPDGKDILLPIKNVIGMAAGHIASATSQDLVLLQVNSLEDQQALIFLEENGYEKPAYTRRVLTPRDVLIRDLSGNGCGDIVIAQGRGLTAFTSQSLLFPVDGSGNIAATPKTFVTHNCIEVYAADVDGDGKEELIFFNQQESSAYGHIPVHVYLGGKEGFQPEKRLEFPGHSAGSMLPVDFNDDGWPDILVMQNGEDQPFLNPPGDLYFGSPRGFDQKSSIQINAPLAWGGHCADLDRDGYLDIIGCCGNEVRILYGSKNGWSDRVQILKPAPEGEPAGALWPALADLNGDGWLDLVVPLSWQPYSLIYWGGPEGFREDDCTKLPIENALTVRIADLNRDGYPELVFGSRASCHRDVYHEGSVTIFWGSPEGYSVYNACMLPSFQTNNITIQDLNGDGWLDIFASSYFNKRERDIDSYIYWNDHGSFSVTNRKRFFAHSSSAAWACDFNEDGYVDICLTHHRAYGNHRTDSAIWWNGPAGFSEERRSWLPTIGPHDMVPTDAGDILSRSPEETYITPVVEAAAVTRIGWAGELPQKTWVSCQVRSADTMDALAQAPFVGCDGTEGSRFACLQEIPEGLRGGKYLQVKLYLGAINSGSTPRITEIYAE